MVRSVFIETLPFRLSYLRHFFGRQTYNDSSFVYSESGIESYITFESTENATFSKALSSM